MTGPDIDLCAARDPADLVDALYAARREDRRDLRGQVELLLRHGDPIVREEALSLLLVKWGVADLRSAARDLLLGDPDSGVRARAAFALAAVSEGAARHEVAQLLADVYLANADSAPVRRACFEGLSFLAGQPRLVELDDTDRRQVNSLLATILAS
jgi:HEAT repeat protein